MSDKNVTIIISDLHVGGGPADPGDDHVYQGNQFMNFIAMLGGTPEGKAGAVELFINGDFLEFAQVNPSVYKLGSAQYWCSEAESMQKLEPILQGHPEMFTALRQFSDLGNQVTIAAGNHDVDFFWGDVQKRFQEAAGPVTFALGDEWFTRYDGRLKIGHGHQFDPGNKFESWWNPILAGPDGVARLEMCPGTLFMVKFVNWLEEKYPFSDNIKPVTALRRILWKEDRFSLVSVAWMLTRFASRHPKFALGADADKSDLAKRLRQRLEFDDNFAAKLTTLYQKVCAADADIETVRQALNTDEAVFTFLLDLLPSLPPEEWMPVIDIAGQGAALGVGGTGQTLAILNPKTRNDKENLRTEAKKELEQENGPEIVVMGHTHQPDEMQVGRGVYFNTGSWTRYADVDLMDNLTMDDLKQEDKFPYQLNYVRVERKADHGLEAAMICFEQG
jgi:UDP-2,3-diacylglucosamine pyrophosphatase LpxH